MACVLVGIGSDTSRVAPTRIDELRGLLGSPGLGGCATSGVDEPKRQVTLGVEHLGDEVERLLHHLGGGHLATLESCRHVANSLDELGLNLAHLLDCGQELLLQVSHVGLVVSHGGLLSGGSVIWRLVYQAHAAYVNPPSAWLPKR